MAALLATHLLWLGRAAGFHYDEAWAANFAQRIASEPGFRPVQAMSPYASAWSHYLSAVFLKLFGTSLFAERSSGVAMVAFGIGMMSAALAILGEALAAALLPWIVAFFPALVLNHRFCVEITTFHVLCFGLLCLGLSLRIRERSAWLAVSLIFLSVALGVSSHILFIAPALAAFMVYCLQEKYWNRGDRIAVALCVGALCFFFYRVHLQIPEKGKTLSLLILCALILGLCARPGSLGWLARDRLRAIRLTLTVASFPALLLLIFFAEGSWSARFFAGELRAPFLIGSIALAPAWTLLRLRKNALADPRLPDVLPWLEATTLVTALIAVKPAPRYFEIPLLLSAAIFALALARLKTGALLSAMALWLGAGNLFLQANYFLPALSGYVPEREIRFLFFRDSTSDTLSKQRLASDLGVAGCGFQQIKSDDPRLLEPLRFLSYGDWPAGASKCRYGPTIRVERASRLGSTAVIHGHGHGHGPLAHETLGPFVLLQAERDR